MKKGFVQTENFRLLKEAEKIVARRGAREASLVIIQGKYGVGKSTHKKGDSIYAQPEYFLAGLRSGRSWHYTNFVERGGSIELSVRATDSDTGNWVLIYEDRALADGVV